jgi:hypothetical protein
MRLFRVVLLGSAATLTGIVGAPGVRAADLPERQAAPIEYVRICDAYGTGFVTGANFRAEGGVRV